MDKSWQKRRMSIQHARPHVSLQLRLNSTIIIINYYKSLHRKEKVLHDREKGVIDPRYNLHRFRPLEPHPGGTYTMYTFRVIIKIGAQ